MTRLIDVFLAILGLFFGFPLLLILFLLGLFDTGSPLFFQGRVGRYKVPFTLVKFRTMRAGTASVATHLADASSITPLGRFLRRSKLDELPQLWNVLKGDMSLVGPRPCLPSQSELIDARHSLGVFDVRPGITGLAQIRGVDMSSPQTLAVLDAEMIDGFTLSDYFYCMVHTVLGKGQGDRVSK